MVLGFIPRQERVCFCFFDLKVAAIIAVIASMMVAVYDMTVVHLPLCYDLFKGDDTIFKVLLYFSYIRLIGGCLTFISALLFFIVNVIMKKSFECTSDCFALLIVLTLFIRSMCIVLTAVSLIKSKRECSVLALTVVDIVFLLLTVIIFDYAISVNGYNFEVKMFGDDDDEES